MLTVRMLIFSAEAKNIFQNLSKFKMSSVNTVWASAPDWSKLPAPEDDGAANHLTGFY